MFTQKFLFAYRSLSLEPDGLRVVEKMLNAHNELTIPYEELLPIGTARFKYVPVRLTAACFFVFFGCVKVFYDYVLHGDKPNSAAC